MCGHGPGGGEFGVVLEVPSGLEAVHGHRPDGEILGVEHDHRGVLDDVEQDAHASREHGGVEVRSEVDLVAPRENRARQSPGIDTGHGGKARPARDPVAHGRQPLRCDA